MRFWGVLEATMSWESAMRVVVEDVGHMRAGRVPPSWGTDGDGEAVALCRRIADGTATLRDVEDCFDAIPSNEGLGESGFEEYLELRERFFRIVLDSVCPRNPPLPLFPEWKPPCKPVF